MNSNTNVKTRTKICYDAKTDISTTKGIRHQFYLRLIEKYYKKYQATNSNKIKKEINREIRTACTDNNYRFVYQYDGIWYLLEDTKISLKIKDALGNYRKRNKINNRKTKATSSITISNSKTDATSPNTVNNSKTEATSYNIMNDSKTVIENNIGNQLTVTKISEGKGVRNEFKYEGENIEGDEIQEQETEELDWMLICSDSSSSSSSISSDVSDYKLALIAPNDKNTVFGLENFDNDSTFN